MPIITNYVCDRCKTLQLEPEQMWEIKLELRHLGALLYLPTSRKPELWCRSCVDEMQILVPLIRADGTTSPITLESIITDLIHKVIEDNV